MGRGLWVGGEGGLSSCPIIVIPHFKIEIWDARLEAKSVRESQPLFSPSQNREPSW